MKEATSWQAGISLLVVLLALLLQGAGHFSLDALIGRRCRLKSSLLG
ncbi:hypothetical protein [Neisseria weixii]|nr:hypothetical protein [Neisseria weixii]